MLFFSPSQIDPLCPLLLGVVNVTPDSFSDGGQFLDPGVAAGRAWELTSQGAGLIDLGAESTRPGARPEPADVQIQRLVPVLKRLEGERFSLPLSVDTTSAEVALACLDAGASVVNDISAGTFDPGMFDLAARRGCPVVLMHMQGRPATMQKAPFYGDVLAEVKAFLQERVLAALEAGIGEGNILLDPGIGFGKTLAHNLALLGALPSLSRHANRLFPLVLGVSRKGMIGQLTDKDSPYERIFGTAGAVAWCTAECVRTQTPLVLRVHDVGAMLDVVKVVKALATRE